MVRVIAAAAVWMAWGAMPAVAQSGTSPAAFARCSVCHAVSAGKPAGLGPNLAGVIGRKAGTLPGYTYSPAMKASAIVWSEEQVQRFIANPQGVVKGTKMYLPGIADAAERAAIVAYLRGLR